MLARKAAPKPLGQISAKDSRSSQYAHCYPLYYWPRGTITVGVLQRPEEGRPMSFEAWKVLEGYYLKHGERSLPLGSVLWHISQAICATWQAIVGGVVDIDRALQIFESWQRPPRVAPVVLERGLTVFYFNRVE